MEISATILSTEKVRPSSPTPHHLQTYEISMLDQTTAPMGFPIVLYYNSSPINVADQSLENVISSCSSDDERDQLLKNSLSEILTRFYPLAGRIGQDGLSIVCDDEGVPFIVARFTGQKLSDLLQNPDPQVPLGRLLPCELTWDAEMGPGDNVMMVQVSHFDCGGMAIGIVFCHKITDAITAATVLSSWAAAVTGECGPLAARPLYMGKSLFPQKEELKGQMGSIRSILKKGKSVMRRYVFDSSAIFTLKAGINNNGTLEHPPTRVEVVSALLWKCFMVASVANGKSASLVTHVVNLRRRARPPCPNNYFGNFAGLAVASCSNDSLLDHDGEIIFGELVKKMRDAIGKIDGDFVSRMEGEDGFSGYCENQRRTWEDVPQDADFLCMSSWCNFGLYGVDFGWGKPVWVTRCDAGSDSDQSLFLNVVWLTDTRHGDGIEAWVILDEKYMNIFENVEELKKLASLEPSPLSLI